MNAWEVAVFSALFGAPCVNIVWECVRDPSLFALHPAMNAIAFLLCTPVALLLMVERKSTTKHQTRVLFTKLHLTLHLAAGVCMAIGGVAAFQTKRVYGKPHFRSPHSWAAITTSLLFSLNIFQGLLLTFEKKSPNWQWKDETHVLVGSLVYIGSATTMVYGLHSGTWGAQHLGGDRQQTLAIAIGLGHVLLLGKAFLSSRRHGEKGQRHETKPKEA